MIVAFDLVGTLTTCDIVPAMCTYLSMQGYAAAVRLFLLRNLPVYKLAKHGIGDFQKAKNQLIADMVPLLKGWTEEGILKMCEWVVEHEAWPQRREDVINELRQHHLKGRRIVIASVVYQQMVEVFAHRVGADSILGTELEIVDGLATGQILGQLNAGDARVARLEKVKEDYNCSTLYATYGNTLADVPLMERSQNPVAVYPDKKLTQLARQREWRILQEPDTGS